MRRFLLVCLLLVLIPATHIVAQCPINILPPNTDLIPANNDTLFGTYIVDGDFIVGPGVVVVVKPFYLGGCGELVVQASGNIVIDGAISGDESGLTGGTGGLAGSANSVPMIEVCPIPTDACGDIFTYGGVRGNDGGQYPGGGGQGGQTGNDGSGRKARCQTFGDDGGRVGGSGGGGGGAGGSYASASRPGGNGSHGTLATMSVGDNSCTTNPINFGTGGNGGQTGNTYGTPNGFGIDMGSGGAGGGGGGRGRYAGLNGGIGGHGGGKVFLESGGDMSISGLISVNGGEGEPGGKGGDSGESDRCCTDLCPGVDEYTHTGAGGAGGGAGGGSGGGILLKVNGVANIQGTLNAIGGKGGLGGVGGAGYNLSRTSPVFICFPSGTTTASAPAATNAQQGGGGSGGRIKVFYNECAPGNTVTPTTNIAGGSGNQGLGGTGTVYTGTDSSFVLGTVQPLQQTICFNGDPAQLNALPSTGGYNSIAYQWQSQPGCAGPWSNIPFANSLNYDPPPGLQQTTCYRLEVVSGTCFIFSDTMTVDVLPPLNANISPSGSLAICEGDSVFLSTPPSAGASYQWLFNGLPIPGATNPTYTAGQTGDYSIIISYPVGCDALSPATTITVDPLPPAFISSGGITSVCPGESVTLQALGGGTYQWFLNGSPIPGATGTFHNATQGGDYAVEVTSAGGCQDTSALFNIIQGSQPNGILSANGPLTFCQGRDSVLLQASGGDFYQWQINGASQPGATDSTFWAPSSGTYSVIVMDSMGCRDTTNTLTVTAFPTPNAVLTPTGSINLCLDDSLLLVAAGGGSYQWFHNNVSLNDTNSWHVATAIGDYFVIVTGPGGCMDTTVSFALNYWPPNVPGIGSARDPFLCPGDSLLLQSSPGTAYQWFYNGAPMPGSTNQTIQSMQPGIYTVITTDQNGCDFESAPFVVSPGPNPQAGLEALGPLPLCDGDSVLLHAFGGDDYQWFYEGSPLPGATDSLLWVSINGNYSVVVSTSCGSDTSANINVTIVPGPIANFEYTNHEDYQIEFKDSSISGATWMWFLGDLNGSTSTNQNPWHTYNGPGEYTVTMVVWDIWGCSDTITKTVTVTNPNFYIPNVFSPNDDGVNDVFWTDFGSLENISFRIWDRWGEVVFRAEDNQSHWNGSVMGKPAPEGAYYFRLDAVNHLEEEVGLTGYLTLVR